MELKNKKVAFLGDSITEGVGTTAPEFRYVNKFGEMAECEVFNYGISGTRYAIQSKPSDNPRHDLDFISRIDEMTPNADIVVVFGGTNDYDHGDAPMGNFSDRDGYTFYGACHTIYSRLIEKYPSATIVVMTPLHRLRETNVNAHANCTLIDYIRAEREVAEYYSIPVLDLFKVSGMQPAIDIIREKYMPDGLHPSNAGAAKIAERLYGFLSSL